MCGGVVEDELAFFVGIGVGCLDEVCFVEIEEQVEEGAILWKMLILLGLFRVCFARLFYL